MGIAGKSITISDAVNIGSNPSGKLNNLPTLVVRRSSSEPLKKSISFAGNIQAVNFITGMNAILQSATLTTNAIYLFIKTTPDAFNQSGVVTLVLDNGGTINGQATPYILAFGAPIEFQFDGTNLN